MPSPLQARKAEEKLGIILDRVGAIRVRLNSLAWQGAVFGVLGWTIGCVALVLLAAYYLPPLPFLGSSILLLAAMLYGLFRTGRAVWLAHSSMFRAAELADQRAGLKGRLETIVQLGRVKSSPAEAASPIRSASAAPMWSYLIEDTLAHQGEFEPARIENRLLSRSIYGLLGALAIALLAFPLIQSARRNARHPASGRSEITLGLNDLKLQPADPGSNNGVEVHADARTMKILREMMAAQGLEHRSGSPSSLSRLLNRARGFANKLQSKLTGLPGSNRPRINLKLADAGKNPGGLGQMPPPTVPEPPANNPPEPEPQKPPNQTDSALPPMQQAESASREKKPDAGKAQANASQQGGPGNQEKPSTGDQIRRGRGDHNGSAGSSHGSGADPDSLFGQRTEPHLGNQGFQIAIEARPMANGPKAEGHPYVPPKVDTPLNPEQQPDQPVPRVSIPQQDRAAVKSVFER
jgi:hypothetical protein